MLSDLDLLQTKPAVMRTQSNTLASNSRRIALLPNATHYRWTHRWNVELHRSIGYQETAHQVI